MFQAPEPGDVEKPKTALKGTCPNLPESMAVWMENNKQKWDSQI